MKRLLILIAGIVVAAQIAHAFDPAVYDITMQAGEDYRLSLTLSDSTARPLNLTGYSYASQFRAAPGGAVFANYSAVLVDATKGRLDVRLSRATTLANSSKAGVWDLRQTDAAGLVTYIFRGKVAVQPTVTR